MNLGKNSRDEVFLYTLMNKNPFTNIEFKKIYSKVPRLCINVVVRTSGGIILALRKKYGWENQWHIPGGTLFYKESVEEAIDRIAKNELGVKIKDIKLLGYTEFSKGEEKKVLGFGNSVSLTFLCDLVSGLPRPDKNSSEIKIFLKLPNNIINIQKKFLLNHWSEISENKF